MSTRRSVGQLLGTWFDLEAPRATPSGLVESVLDEIRDTQPVPLWRAMLTTSPMRPPGNVLVGSPTLRLARLLVALVALAALVAVAALLGAGSLNWADRIPNGLDTPSGYRLNLSATRLAIWTTEGDDRYAASRPEAPPGEDFLGDLIVERPQYVFEWWPRERVAVPSDLERWLQEYPGLDVIRVESVLLGGRLATAIDALPVFPTPDKIHYPHLLPVLFLDGAWQYRLVLVDLGAASWMVATCGALREDYGGSPWTDASRACDELLATWEWMP